VRLAVRVVPRASRNRAIGAVAEADGGVALKIQVTAAPEGGRANDAVVKLLAKALGVAKSRISVAQGAADRRKVLYLEGDTRTLMRALEKWMAALNDR